MNLIQHSILHKNKKQKNKFHNNSNNKMMNLIKSQQQFENPFNQKKTPI